MSIPPEFSRWSPNQLVAYNLERARKLRHLTQAEAGQALEPYLGKPWSEANFGMAERSWRSGKRVRHFSADEILAFSLAFGLPPMWFFTPPEKEIDAPAVIAPQGASKGVDPQTLMALLFYGDWPEIEARLRVSDTVLGPEGRAELVNRYRFRLFERIRDAVGAEVGALEETEERLIGLADLLRAGRLGATQDVASDIVGQPTEKEASDGDDQDS